MAEFKMSRNGSGYYDETAYNGLNGMVKEGEVWTSTNNLGSSLKEFLIVKNHGNFCTALLMCDEPAPNRIEVNGICFKRYTDPRFVQYIYNSNIAQRLAKLPDNNFDEIRAEVFLALQIDDLDCLEEDAPICLEPAISDMVALFGTETVKGYLKCSFYLNKLTDNETFAGQLMDKLLELEGDCDE